MDKVGETATYWGARGERIDIRYCDELVTIFENAKDQDDMQKVIPGWTWGIWEGEGYAGAIGKRAWPAREEAIADAKKTISAWEETDRETAKEIEEHRRFLAKIFYTKEEAIEAGANQPTQYHCDECGADFWAEWRSKYSPSPTCPVCEGDDMTYEEGTPRRYEKLLNDGIDLNI
jgi:hypothetical protein